MSDQQRPQGHERRFCRLDGPEWLGGVAAGLAYWLGLPTWIIRVILTVLLVFVPYVGTGVLIGHVLLWIFVPKADAPEDYEERSGNGQPGG